MSTFYIKRNDTSPALEFQLQDSGGTPVDITGYNDVSFLLKEYGADTLTVDDDTSGNVVVNDASNGIVAYEWATGDTDEAGEYTGEFEVEYADGTVETFPNNGFIEIQIKRDLG